MKKIHLIFAVDAPLSDRDYERFGFSRLKNRGVEVECWDFSNLRNPKLMENALEPQTIKHKNRIFKDCCELDACSNQLANSIVIDFRSGIYKKYTIQWFRKHGAILAVLLQGVLPLSVWQPSLSDKIIHIKQTLLNKFNFALPKKIIDFIKAKAFYKDYDIVVCTGQQCFCGKVDLCIHSHSFDYDLYLNIGGFAAQKGYVVFLDEGMVEHPDYYKLRIKPYCTEKKYFQAMNDLFDRIEHDLNLPVIIAAHPRTKDVKALKSSYNGRRIVMGRTPVLVRDANMVIAHTSTSISFAVLWKKPLLVVTTNELEKRVYHVIAALCQLLRVQPVNADCLQNDYDWLEIAGGCIYRYDAYKKKLIKKESSPEKNSWDIFVDALFHYESSDG